MEKTQKKTDFKQLLSNNILTNIYKTITSKTVAYIIIVCMVFFAFKTSAPAI